MFVSHVIGTPTLTNRRVSNSVFQASPIIKIVGYILIRSGAGSIHRSTFFHGYFFIILFGDKKADSACSVALCRPSMRWLFRSGLPIEAFLHGAHTKNNFLQGRTANFIKFIVSSSLALFPPFFFLP